MCKASCSDHYSPAGAIDTTVCTANGCYRYHHQHHHHRHHHHRRDISWKSKRFNGFPQVASAAGVDPMWDVRTTKAQQRNLGLHWGSDWSFSIYVKQLFLCWKLYCLDEAWQDKGVPPEVRQRVRSCDSARWKGVHRVRRRRRLVAGSEEILVCGGGDRGRGRLCRRGCLWGAGKITSRGLGVELRLLVCAAQMSSRVCHS